MACRDKDLTIHFKQINDMRLLPKRKIKRDKGSKPSSYKTVYDNYRNWEERFYNEGNLTKRSKAKTTRRKVVIKSPIEERIAKKLDNLGISYEREKYLPGCENPKTMQKLRFDFYLPEINTAIEYDGRQHFKSIKTPDGTMSDITSQRYRDKIKNKYCIQKGVHLIRLDRHSIKYIDSVCRELQSKISAGGRNATTTL